MERIPPGITYGENKFYATFKSEGQNNVDTFILDLKTAVNLQPDANFHLHQIIPYFKQIRGVDYDLHVRKDMYPLEPVRFCLDLAQREDAETVSSKGWIDFSIQSNTQKRKIYALVNFRDDSMPKSDHIIRPVHNNFGLYVHPEYRQQRIGTSLISIARVILHDLGVSTLVLSEIHEAQEEAARGRFYRRAGGYMFHLEEYMDAGGETHYRGKSALPTTATPKRPYIFE